MLPVNKYRNNLLNEFYLDSDDITIRRKKDGYYGRFKKDDVVTFFNNDSLGRPGVHIPRTRSTVSRSHLLCLLRGIDIPEGSVVDHIDGNVNNDSRNNLRVVTQQINVKNSKKRKNNTSGYTGINWNESAESWTVRTTIKGKRLYLGSRITLEAAVELLESYAETLKADGYTERHGK